jgi:hypothetical protein
MPLGRSVCKREDNIKINLEETAYEGVAWIYLPENKDQCRTLVNTVMNLWVL